MIGPIGLFVVELLTKLIVAATKYSKFRLKNWVFHKRGRTRLLRVLI